MALTTNVPSDQFEDLQRDVQDATRFVNQASGTFLNRVGLEITPIPVANSAIASDVAAVDASRIAAQADIAADVEGVQNAADDAYAELLLQIDRAGLDTNVTPYTAGLTLDSYTKTYSYDNGVDGLLVYIWRGALGTVTTGLFDEGAWILAQVDIQLRNDVEQGTSLIRDVKHVSSVAALRLLEGKYDGQVVVLTGRTAGSSDGGGHLVWRASATNADDDVVWFAVAGVATGRWELIAGKISSPLNIYINPVSGDDSNAGTIDQPLLSIQAAISYLSATQIDFGEYDVVINLAAGSYAGQVSVPRGLSQKSFLVIKGPFAGHPNVPTAIIDFAQNTNATRGIVSSGRNKIWLEDIKLLGAFPLSLQGALGTRFELRNLHISGSAGSGIQVSNGSRYFVRGGIIENCPVGIEELFSSVRSFSTGVSTRDEQMIIRNCGTAIKAKENCSGHASPLTIEDCEVGLEMQAWSVANVGTGDGLRVRRCDNGIVLTNSEIHNETSSIYGTGADANLINHTSDPPAPNEDV